MKKHILLPLSMLVVMIVVTAGCGPIGPTPGLAIGGNEQPPPADFAFVQDHDLILIRTFFGGWLPQVHNIWGVGVEDGIYAMAVPGARWRARLNDDPNVLVRVGDNTYELTGARVTDPEVIGRVFAVYQDKYGPQLEEILGRPGTIEDMNDLIGFTAR